MIRWLVDDVSERTMVAKSVDGLEKLTQPVTVRHQVASVEIELEIGADINRFKQKLSSTKTETRRRVHKEEKWTVRDKDGQVKYIGKPSGVESGSWFVLRRIAGEKEYRISPVKQWLTFSASTGAQQTAPDLETSERLMKEARLKSKVEFSEYMKLKRLKAEEKGLAVVAEHPYENTLKQKDDKRRKLGRRRIQGGHGDDIDVAESSLSYLGIPKDAEGEWEGEEAFSDDEEAFVEDHANIEHDIEVSDEDVEKDKTVPDDEDMDVQAEELLKDSFGAEIEKIIHGEQKKESVADDDLDKELKEFADETEEEENIEDITLESVPPIPKQQSVPAVSMNASKEEQIRARVKGMFWRSEYKLKLKDVLAQFPGLNRTSEDYIYLTKALKDLAEVKDGVLHLKQKHKR
jgi:hypothetical protein